MKLGDRAAQSSRPSTSRQVSGKCSYNRDLDPTQHSPYLEKANFSGLQVQWDY